MTNHSTSRLLAPDLARGLMLLLIAMAYAGVYVGSGFGVNVSDQPLLDRAAAVASTLFLDNRAFPLFAILFGYGLAWSVTRRQERQVDPTDIRRRLRRRALLLLLLGSLHAVLLFPGEILGSYGFALLLTGWLLLRSDRALHIALALTGAFSLVMVPLIMLGAAVGPGDSFAQAAPGYGTAEAWIERLIGPVVGPVYVAIAYPLLFLVVLGYEAGRARLFERTIERRSLLRGVAWGGIGVSVIGALPAAGLILLPPEQQAPLLTGLAMGLQVITGVAGGAGYAACFALVSDRLAPRLPVATRALAAMGRRSLTVYVLNSLLVTLVLHHELIGVGTHVGHFGALVVAALSWSASLLLAAWLEGSGRSGPLEVVMRRALDGRSASVRQEGARELA